MVTGSVASGADGPRWRRFMLAGGIATLLVFCVLFGFVLFLDPYGRRGVAPIMDINQRYMYPQLARSGRFEGAIFGTSTARLLDPKGLGAAVDARIANLAINAGTPWEQMQLAEVFLRHVPSPSILVFGLDGPWCDPDADRPDKRLTFRAFPPWLYDDDSLNDLPHLVNSKALEIAGRVALNRLGRMRERIRGDGYEVFTPPEASYDLARARAHLGHVEVEGGLAAERDGPLPAARWLGDFARRLPAATRLVLVFPPLHAGSQPPPGSRAEATDAACKRRIIEAVGPGRALVLDYRRRSTLASADENFWDPLHYRLPIAGRIVEDIREGLADPKDPADGRYRILSRPAR